MQAYDGFWISKKAGFGTGFDCSMWPGSIETPTVPKDWVVSPRINGKGNDPSAVPQAEGAGEPDKTLVEGSNAEEIENAS